jgi:hypothetical protein
VLLSELRDDDTVDTGGSGNDNTAERALAQIREYTREYMTVIDEDMSPAERSLTDPLPPIMASLQGLQFISLFIPPLEPYLRELMAVTSIRNQLVHKLTAPAAAEVTDARQAIDRVVRLVWLRYYRSRHIPYFPQADAVRVDEDSSCHDGGVMARRLADGTIGGGDDDTDDGSATDDATDDETDDDVDEDLAQRKRDARSSRMTCQNVTLEVDDADAVLAVAAKSVAAAVGGAESSSSGDAAIDEHAELYDGDDHDNIDEGDQLVRRVMADRAHCGRHGALLNSHVRLLARWVKLMNLSWISQF